MAFILAPFLSNVIWLGDMNYRIDLDNAAVRYMAESDELDGLVAADQVRVDGSHQNHSFLHV